jgi:Phage integrase, N-terminal SAM-like domain
MLSRWPFGGNVMAVRQRAVLEGEITYVVLDREWRVIQPAEAYLEYLRTEGYSPNTVRAYSQGLALWWSMLEDRALDWKQVGVADLVRFRRRSRERLGATEVAGSQSGNPPSSSSAER